MNMARYSKRFLSLLVLGMGLFALGGSSIAQESTRKYSIGLFPLQSLARSLPKSELKGLERQILQQFDQRQNYRIRKRYPLSGSQPKAAPVNPAKLQQQAMAPLYAKLKAVVAMMQDGKYQAAIPKIKEATKLSKKLVKYPGSIATLARLRGLLALAQFQLGQTEKGEETLQVLAKMAPDPLPPEVKKSRIMRRMFQRSAREASRGPKARLQILGTTGATVYIDGKKRGTIPLDLDTVPKGLRYLRVQKTGFYPKGQTMLLTQSVMRVQVTLKAIPPRQLTPEEAAQGTVATQVQLLQLETTTIKDGIDTLCRLTNIDFLLLGHMKKVGDQHYLFKPIVANCKNRKVVTGDDLQLNTDLLDVDGPIAAAYRQLLQKQTKVAVAVVIPERRQPPRLPPPRDRGPVPLPKAGGVHTKWWFWTLLVVGVGGAAAATTTVILMNQPPRIAVKADWSGLQ